ncbi:MAG TPA: PH domain-containing protein [Trebonia sp.]|nr:PH domain-containing protein [Trebonia sp.]
MRMAPNFDRVPHTVERHLLPHERQVLTVRFHPAVLIKPVAVTLAALAVALLVTMELPVGAVVALVIWAVFLGILGWLSIQVYAWLEDYFVVTSQRLLLTTGIVTRTVNMMPLTKVTDMSFKRSAWGRVLGYGEFVVESAGQDQALRHIRNLPYPEQLYLEVCGLIFKDAGDSDD